MKTLIEKHGDWMIWLLLVVCLCRFIMDERAKRLQQQLLAVLAPGKQGVTGRDLKQAYESTYGRSISYGAMYVAMRKLEEQDQVVSWDVSTGHRITRFFTRAGPLNLP